MSVVERRSAVDKNDVLVVTSAGPLKAAAVENYLVPYATPDVAATLGTSSAAAPGNRTKIQNELNRGGYVVLNTPGIYYIDDTLVIYSDTVLYLGPGVSLRMTASTNKTVIKNLNFDATKTAVTGNPTSSGTTITVSATAHGLSVGDYACLMGSTVNGYEGIFPVATVPDANSLTLTADRAPDSATSSGTCYVRKADTNITIIGPGAFDQDQANQTFPVNNTELHAVRLQGIRNLVLDRIVIKNARKYALHLITTQDVLVNRPYFPVTNSDGVHLEGMARNVTIIDPSGKTGDDAVALTIMQASPAATFAYTVPSNYHPGNQVDVNVYGINVNTNQASLKITGDTGYYFDRINVCDIGGTFKTSCVSIIDDTADLTGAGLKSITIDGVRATIDGSASGSVYQFTYNATGAAGTIVVRDFIQDSSSLLTGGGTISGAGTIDRLVFDGYSTRDGGAVSVVGLLFGASTTINQLNLSKVRWVAGANASARFVHLSGSTSIGFLQGSDWSISGDALGNGVYHAAGTITVTQIDNARVSGCRSVYENTTGASATPEVQISNVVLQSSAGQVVNMAQSTNVEICNVRGASIGNNIIQIGATSKTFNIRAFNFFGTLTQHMSYGTTNTINLYADSTVSVDGSKLTVGTGTKGALFYNNNASFSTGQGLYGVSESGSAVKIT
jgi:hypothetical protein